MKEHNKFLALSLLTYQPPLRTSFFYILAQCLRPNLKMCQAITYILIITQGRRRRYFIVNQDKAYNNKEYANIKLWEIKYNIIKL